VNLAAWGAEIRRITVLGQPKEKVSETSISKPSWPWWCVPVIPVIKKVN
jgi:hypothetical protein